jgi:hypothetical protein
MSRNSGKMFAKGVFIDSVSKLYGRRFIFRRRSVPMSNQRLDVLIKCLRGFCKFLQSTSSIIPSLDHGMPSSHYSLIIIPFRAMYSETLTASYVTCSHNSSILKICHGSSVALSMLLSMSSHSAVNNLRILCCATE